MALLNRSIFFAILALQVFFQSCQGQQRQATVDPKIMDTIPPEKYGMPALLSARDTSPCWQLQGTKLLLTGTVYQQDGHTPASGVILYYYQTSTSGRYEVKPAEKRNLPKNSEGQSHGYIRGWVKTGADGKYEIYTVRPGTYPTRDEPAHVHVTVTDPFFPKSYYIDDFVFDDDVLLTTKKRLKMENRSGSGVLRLVKKGNLWIGERNIILGLHIPGYPDMKTAAAHSGREIGENVVSFTPHHAWGPDKGTRTCPVCKYGWYHGILYFAGNRPDWTDIKNGLHF